MFFGRRGSVNFIERCASSLERWISNYGGMSVVLEKDLPLVWDHKDYVLSIEYESLPTALIEYEKQNNSNLFTIGYIS